MPSGVYIRTEYHRNIISKSQLGRKLSEKHKIAISKAHKGKLPKNFYEIQKLGWEANRKRKGRDIWNWKGDKVGYGALHDWVIRKLGQPQECWKCYILTAKRYEWSNISGKYLRNIDDFIRLCHSCHAKFDRKNPKRPQFLWKAEALTKTPKGF